MAMVCPQCRKSYDQLSQCPTCQVSLMFQANLTTSQPEMDDSSPSWQQTPWGRMIVGVILAQGLAHSLYFLLSATFQSGAEFAVDLSNLTTGGLLLWHAVQGVSLIVGGIIAGAGRRRGYVYGSLVGFANSLIFIGIQFLQQTALAEMLLFQPIIHMGFGAIGGFIGWMIWKPLPMVEWDGATAKSRMAKGPKAPWKILAGPIHWLRVFAGTGLVVCGVVWASSILEFVINASEGNLQIESHMQARLVSLEISALAVLLGGALAGATTFNGLKQGLVVGFFGAMVLLGFLFSRPDTTFELLMSYLTGIFFLASVGGWFGGQLFPPVMSYKRKRYTPAS